MKSFFSLISLLIISTSSLFASGPKDSLNIHSPKSATIKSTIIPGWGQVYNKKYWKVPIVYGALTSLGYWVYFNSDKYSSFRSAYQIRTDGDPGTIDIYDILDTISTEPKFSETQILKLRDDYRRDLDMSVLLVIAVYVLNIADACVDAHMFDFDVSDDLSLNIRPYYIHRNSIYSSSGIALSFNF